MAADMEKIETILMENEEKLEKTLNVFKEDLIQVRVGRANPRVLDKVIVDYYGTPTPVNQVGNLSVVDGTCLVVAPWDKSMLKVVEKAILQANIGLTPTNDGTVIRLVFPALTEERRKELVKQIKKMCEDAKVAARNIRRDTLDVLKKLKTNKEVTEDEFDDFSETVEESVTKTIEKIDKAAAEKEKDVMIV
ncbi:MAG: ribosome recycling factor [Candidatus Borkfalkiaceae bacterium]|nr:ribosome recycling factor [Christensenellaceae bacterium]